MIELSNCNGTAESFWFLCVSGQGGVPFSIKTPRMPLYISSKPTFSVETVVRFELSMVKQVEAVFVDREADGEYKIISVVNQRDVSIREKVYEREEAIMDEYPTLKFDFHVLARMNRKIEDVITTSRKSIFNR